MAEQPMVEGYGFKSRRQNQDVVADAHRTTHRVKVSRVGSTPTYPTNLRGGTAMIARIIAWLLWWIARKIASLGCALSNAHIEPQIHDYRKCRRCQGYLGDW